jgi:hypothetical protein
VRSSSTTSRIPPAAIRSARLLACMKPRSARTARRPTMQEIRARGRVEAGDEARLLVGQLRSQHPQLVLELALHPYEHVLRGGVERREQLSALPDPNYDVPEL